MKRHLQIAAIVLTVVLFASCSAQKRAWYIQDAQPYTPEQIVQNGQIRIKPLDRITVVVNSKNPELAVPFNAWSSFNSVSGLPAQSSGTQSLQILTVDEEGMLRMPVIGAVEAAGRTRGELARAIAEKITQEGYINDPSVNVEFADMKIAIIGEVARPGYYDLTRDKISIFDALALAGDITVYGVRDQVAVTREVDGVRTIEYIDLTTKEAFDSPAFYLQQNDVVYVKPNKYKAQTGEISQNRNFYLSLAATAISVATLIVTLTK